METSWIKYRNTGDKGIEYLVECDDTGDPLTYSFHGERCVRMQTIRNYSLKEQVHQPAFTMMPVEHFPDLYARVGA